MKPYKSFLFLLFILLFALGTHALLMPERFLNSVSRGLAYFKGGNKSTTANSDMFLTELKKKDSAIAAINAYYYVNPEIFVISDLQDIPLIPFVYSNSESIGTNTSGGNISIDNPLKQLYKDLLQLQKNPQLLRFLYYGDEQIKDDRITKTFRKLLQRTFGGDGSGTISLFQNNYSGSSVSREAHKPLSQSDYSSLPTVKISDNWSVMSMQKNQRRGNYGLCNAYLYPPAINAIITARTTEKGTVEVRGIASENNLFLEALLHENVWVEKDLRITALINAAGSSGDISGKTGGRAANGKAAGNKAAGSKTARGNAENNKSERQLGVPVKNENSFGLQHCVWRLPDSTTGINISLALLKNRNIYALSINSESGIIVDNLFMHNSTGNIFLKNNRRFLIDNYALMNVRLVIYQFKPTSSDFYQTMLRQELGYLRITMPDVPVIVIGDSEIQRKIAVENGCVYWKLQKDADAELTGKMLYKAFINDYRNFVTKEKEREINEYTFIY
jgi:hypothetical protein